MVLRSVWRKKMLIKQRKDYKPLSRSYKKYYFRHEKAYF